MKKKGKFINSLSHAWHGLVYVYKHERNFRIQIFVSAVVLFFAFFFGILKSELLFILLITAIVLLLEMVNSAIEKFLDSSEPRLKYHIRLTKDIMASAVLMASVGAVIIGGIIFWPYIIDLFN